MNSKQQADLVASTHTREKSSASGSTKRSGGVIEKREFLRRGSRRDSNMNITYPELPRRKVALVGTFQVGSGFSKPAGWSTLHFAAKQGNVEVVQRIMQQGSGDLVKLKSPTGETPLHLAVQYNHIDVCEYLLRHHETDVNERNHQGITPLDMAYSNKRRRLIAMLTERGGRTRSYDSVVERRASTTVAL